MSTQEINPKTLLAVLMEQRNDAFNKLASSAALNIELEQKIKSLESADENKED